MRGAKHGCIFVENNGNGNARENFRHRSFIRERSAEAALFQFRQNLHGNTAGQKKSTVRQNA